MAELAPVARQQFFKANGEPASNYKLYTRVSGSATPKATYQDEALGTANSNPITLDSKGYAPAAIWLDDDEQYRFILDGSGDLSSPEWTEDDIGNLSHLKTNFFLSSLEIVKDTIADAIGVAAAVGRYIRTGGYTSFGDEGGALYRVVAGGTGTDDGGTYHDMSNGNQLQLMHNGHTSLMQYGCVGDGTTDDATQFKAALDSGISQVHANEGKTFYIGSQQTITSKDNIRLWGKGTIKIDNLDGAVNFSSCDNVTVEGITLLGHLDKTAWEALTGGQRQTHRAVLLFTSCDKPVVRDVKSTGYTGVVKYQTCTNSYTENVVATGVFGPVSGGIATDPNFGYLIFVNGGSDHELHGCWGKETGGTVLIGLSTPRVKNFGGGCTDHHDTAYYGSSCDDSSCTGFATQDGLANSVKFRGSRNKIIGCSAADTTSVAFVLSAIPLDSLVDSQGAAGHGGSMVNNTAKDCKALARIDRTVEVSDNLYMRDTIVSNNIGENMTDTVSAPILLYGVKNIICTNNTVNTFAAPAAIQANGEALSDEGKGFKICDNVVANGARLFSLVNIVDSEVSRNQYENLSQTIVSTLTNAYNNIFNDNHGDDTAKRIDVRQATATGTHDGSNNASVLTDSGASWTVNGLVGRVIKNTTDGSEGTITANTATTITATLSGGTDNDWDTGDSYSFMTVGKSTCLNNRMYIQGNNNIQGESYSQGNSTDPNYDITTLIPEQRGHLVSNGTNMYIAKNTTATTDWVLV